MATKKPTPELDEHRIEDEIERRAEQIWKYVRSRQNSLCSETHINAIRAMVQVRFVHWRNVVAALQEESSELRGRVARRNSTIKELRQENLRLNRELLNCDRAAC